MINNVQADQATSSAQEQSEDLRKYAVAVDDLALKVSSMTAQRVNSMTRFISHAASGTTSQATGISNLQLTKSHFHSCFWAMFYD